MASYAVQVRIDGVRPQRPGSPTRRVHAARAARTSVPDHLDRDRAPVDLVGRPIGEIVADRWARIREAWGQTTFFLFDPDSWR